MNSTPNQTANAHVVFVSVVPPQPYLTERFFFDQLAAAGIAVEVWYVAGCFPASSLEGCLLTTNLPYKALADVKEFARTLADHPSRTFVLLFNFERRTAKLFSALRQYDKTLIFYSWGVFPSAAAPASSRSLARIVRGLLHRISLLGHRQRNGAEFDIVCYAGAEAIHRAKARRQYIPVNLPDWEVARKLRATDTQVQSDTGNAPYLVFLDCCVPFHPDYALLGLKRIDPESYGDRLARFFDQLEQQYGVEVVIAAHPKAAYPPNYFRNRRLISGKTAELVKDCRAVLGHHSLSASYAIIFRKPIFFTYCQEWEDPAYGPHIMPILRGWSDMLRMPLINLDDPPPHIDWPPIVETLYADYVRAYFTERTDDRTNFEILRDLILDRPADTRLLEAS